ncbi:uncharacterized protein CTRU02_202071 [Colletotrichum truncatum]|uniref:Uncharacterized protein n=1 Tax=Colletotrichum truncatum TaxID=5467 RepID=A0ACC3ZJD2_COLTU
MKGRRAVGEAIELPYHGICNSPVSMTKASYSSASGSIEYLSTAFNDVTVAFAAHGASELTLEVTVKHG